MLSRSRPGFSRSTHGQSKSILSLGEKLDSSSAQVKISEGAFNPLDQQSNLLRPAAAALGCGDGRHGGMPAAAVPGIPEGRLTIEMRVKSLGFGYARPAGFWHTSVGKDSVRTLMWLVLVEPLMHLCW